MKNKIIILFFLVMLTSLSGLYGMHDVTADLNVRSATLRTQLADRKDKLTHALLTSACHARGNRRNAWLASAISVATMATTGYRAATGKASGYDAVAAGIAGSLGLPFGFISAHSASTATACVEVTSAQLAEVAALNLKLDEADALLNIVQGESVTAGLTAHASVILNLVEEKLKRFEEHPKNVLGEFIKDLWGAFQRISTKQVK